MGAAEACDDLVADHEGFDRFFAVRGEDVRAADIADGVRRDVRAGCEVRLDGEIRAGDGGGFRDGEEFADTAVGEREDAGGEGLG